MHYHYFTLEQRESLERQIRAMISHPPAQAETLRRLRSPEYGVCRRCGADIPFVRLMARPEAVHCAACEANS
jgi:RNA polymerase-binding transcription factor DksA